MKNFSRQTYNSQYYQQNRERIRSQRLARKSKSSDESQTDTLKNQLSLFDGSNQMLKQSNSFQTVRPRISINGILIVLVIANTYFLINEAVEFYRTNNASIEFSVLPAILVELLLLSFSAIRAPNLLGKVAIKLGLALLFVYSSWSLSSRIIGNGYGVVDSLATVERQMVRLANRIRERELLIHESIKRDQVYMARRLTLEKDKLSTELSDLERKRSELAAVPITVQAANTWSMVFLRLLLQLSNIVIVHYLVGSSHRSKKIIPRRIKTPIVKRLLSF